MRAHGPAPRPAGGPIDAEVPDAVVPVVDVAPVVGARGHIPSPSPTSGSVRTAPAAQARPSPWRQMGLLMQWQLRRSATAIPLLVVVQTMLSIATVIGYGLLVGPVDRPVGLYLTTGAPTISLVMLGLVMTPQWVGQERTEGSLDWMRTLPVPRVAFLVSDLAVWSLLALPGMVLGLLVGSARFHVGLSLSWKILPGVLLVSLTAAAIGYAVANVLAPTLAQLVSQVLVFVVMLFSPISYPADRLAPWAQQLHQWLPFEPMAQVVRAGLASADFAVPGRSWVVLGLWCVASVSAAAWALGRRQ